MLNTQVNESKKEIFIVINPFEFNIFTFD